MNGKRVCQCQFPNLGKDETPQFTAIALLKIYRFTVFTDPFFTGKTVKNYFGKNGKFFTVENPKPKVTIFFNE